MRTNENIAEEIAQLFDSKPDVSLWGTSNELRIEISRMYDYVDLTFQKLGKISEILGTDHIDISDRSSSGGWETCDYGSCYTVTLIARGVKR